MNQQKQTPDYQLLKKRNQVIKLRKDTNLLKLFEICVLKKEI